MSKEVTILMTTCNEKKDIFKNALNSILNQTYKNIKILIIVDNKDNNDVINIIREYKNIDNRIEYIINEKNIGLPKSLNKGIDLIKTEYIARMDADDISLPNRIEKQLEYAENNYEISLFGANIIYMDYLGNKLYERNIHNNEYNDIKRTMKYINIFHHPTLFGKTEIFKEYKYRELQYSQDYDLICRLLENNYKIGNMNEYLLYYRLPDKVNDEKLYKQKITYYCIQEKYKKRELNSTDIIEYTNKKIVNENKNKINIIKSFKLYEKAIKQYKDKNYLAFAMNIVKSCILSKYQRIQLTNMLKYYIMKGKSNDNKTISEKYVIR